MGRYTQDKRKLKKAAVKFVLGEIYSKLSHGLQGSLHGAAEIEMQKYEDQIRMVLSELAARYKVENALHTDSSIEIDLMGIKDLLLK